MSRRICTLLICSFLCITSGYSQLEVEFATSSTASQGGQVEIDVIVNDWEDLVTVQFSINWDSLVLSYNSVTNIAGVVPNFNSSSIGTPDLGGALQDGKMSVSWTESLANPVTVPNGTRLFSIVLDVEGDLCDLSTFVVSNDPTISEAILPDFSTNIGVVDVDLEVQIPGPGCDGTGMQCGPNNGNPACDFGNINNTHYNLPDIIAESGETVCIPWTVDDFTNLSAFQVSMNWDPNLLEYDTVRNFNTNLPGLFASNFFSPSNGLLNTIWTEPSTNQASLPDGAVLVEICFDVIGSNFSTAEISYTQDPDSDFYYNCGSILICEEMDMPSAITLNASDVSGQEGENVCVDISVENFINIESMQFVMSWNDQIAEYTSPPSNFNGMLGVANGNFNTNANNTLTFSWTPPNSLPQTVADSSVLFSVCFDIIGGCENEEVSPFEFINSNNLNIEISSNNMPVPFLLGPGSITVMPCEMTECIPEIMVNNPFCSDDLGSILITVGGSDCDGPLVCNWADFSDTSCTLFAVQPANEYCVTVTDDSGATFDTCIEVLGVNPITIDGENQMNVNCDGAGEIHITNVSGGSGFYSYTWDPPAGDVADLTNIQPGQYCVTIMDANNLNCPTDEMCWTILNEVPPLNVESEKIDAGCELGSITLNVTGGCGNFNCSITPNIGTANGCIFTELPAGMYNWSVEDGMNTVTGMIEVLDTSIPLELTTTVIHETCAGQNDGQICFEISGGCPDYTITAASGTIQENKIIDLSPGSIVITVTDDQGSMYADTLNIDMGSSLVVSTDVTGATANGNGTIIVNASGGTEPYTISISPNVDLMDVPPGLYSVTVEDDNGCSQTILGVEVFWDELVVEIVEVSSENDFSGFGVSCNGSCDGVIDAVITGFNGSITNVVLENSEGNQMTGSLPFSNLCPEIYILTLTDENNLLYQSIPLEVTEPEIIVVETEIECTETNMNNGSITLDVSGGTNEFNFEWGPVTGSLNTLSSLGTGNYTCIINDSNECDAVVQSVEVSECMDDCDGPCYTCSSGIITPYNNDRVNDVFIINCAGNDQNILNIYDRWGRVVYTQSNYSNDWTGIDNNGNQLFEGAYPWVIEVSFPNGENRIFKGIVTILRNN